MSARIEEGFMQAEITERCLWIEIDGPCGTEWIPVDILGGWTGINIPRGSLQPLPQSIKDYCENRECWEVKTVSGYGVRSSAPGYMDRTDWAVYTNKKEAIKEWRSQRRQNAGIED